MFCYRMLYDTRKRKRKFFCVSVALLWPRSRRKFFYGPISFVGYITCDCHVPPCVCLDVQQNSAIQLFFVCSICSFFFFYCYTLYSLFISRDIRIRSYHTGTLWPCYESCNIFSFLNSHGRDFLQFLFFFRHFLCFLTLNPVSSYPFQPSRG